MAEILISGYYGFHNAGDEAILAGLVRAIRELAPDTVFTAISGTAANTRSVQGIAAVSRGDVANIWRAIRRADLIISGGGSLLQDVTSSKSLLYYLGIIGMGRAQFKPVMLYGQGVGPVNGVIGRTMIPIIINLVNQIAVRDRESAETLRRLGVRRPPVSVTADAALALGAADPEHGAMLLRGAGVQLDRPLIGVSVRAWKLGKPALAANLARSLDRLAAKTGAAIAFIPMQQPQDVTEAAQVAGLMTAPTHLVQGDFTYAEIHAMVARCDLLIGMRYHALVFAAMNGVPLVGLSYDPKIDSLLRLVGEKVTGTTGQLDPDVVVAASLKAFYEAPAVRERLLQRVGELTPLARKNAELAVQLLQERSRP